MITQSFRTLKKFELKSDNGYVSVFYYKKSNNLRFGQVELDYFAGLYHNEQEAFDWLEQNKYIERM